MEGRIFSLVYVSSASRLLEDAELEAILSVSKRNNLRDDITGMLLYKGGNIMQVLEGPEEKVLALVDTLRHDPRHYGLQILLRNQIAERQFNQWAMAFYKGEPHTREDLEGRVTSSRTRSRRRLSDRIRPRPIACSSRSGTTSNSGGYGNGAANAARLQID
jgi:hypothetical protein